MKVLSVTKDETGFDYTIVMEKTLVTWFLRRKIGTITETYNGGGTVWHNVQTGKRAWGMEGTLSNICWKYKYDQRKRIETAKANG